MFPDHLFVMRSSLHVSKDLRQVQPLLGSQGVNICQFQKEIMNSTMHKKGNFFPNFCSYFFFHFLKSVFRTLNWSTPHVWFLFFYKLESWDSFWMISVFLFFQFSTVAEEREVPKQRRILFSAIKCLTNKCIVEKYKKSKQLGKK